MNHQTDHRHGIRAVRPNLLFALLAALTLAAAFAPGAGAAIGDHHYLPSLSQLGAFERSCGAATDSHGDLYVADREARTIEIYDPSGHLVTGFAPSANAGRPCGLAVDSGGAVYVTGGESDVVKYLPSSPLPVSGATTYQADASVNGTGALVEEGATDVAVDPLSHEVYVAEGEHISSYTSSGELLSGEIGEGLTEEALFQSVDVYGANHDVYASTEPVAETGVNEVQELEITGATAGTYELSFDGQSTGWQGTGTLNGSTTVSGVSSTSGYPVAGEVISGAGIAPGTILEFYDPGTEEIELSQPATASGSASLSADIRLDAPSLTIARALSRLPSVGQSGIGVECEEEEDEESSTLPLECELTFRFQLGHIDVEPLESDDSRLTGPDPQITVTTVEDGAPEPSGVYVFDPDGTRVEAFFDGSDSDEGPLNEPHGSSIAVDQSNGNVLVSDIGNYLFPDLQRHGVVDEFSADGTFLSQLGPSFAGGQSFSVDSTYGIVVDNGPSSPNQGDIYVASDESIHAFGPLIQGATLKVEKGTNGGTIESSPAGILCGPSCSEQATEFEEGETVVLTETDSSGSRFVGWEAIGCDVISVSGEECQVQMSGARTVKALFIRQFLLTVLPTGAGSGTVTSSPAGIDCGTTCEAEFDEGGTVMLTATAAAGSRLAGWKVGDCQEVIGPDAEQCKVTMSASKLVEPEFIRVYGLTVETGGAGSGTVTSSPAGIDCGSACAADYDEGATAILAATPAAGSRFSGWEAGGCDEILGPSGEECKVRMGAARTVKALFAHQESVPTVKGGTGTDADSSPPFPPAAEGRPRFGPRAVVRGGRAALKITCRGTGGCAGTLKLTVKIRGRTVVLGRARCNLSAGQSKTIEVKLSRRARRLLERGKLEVEVSWSGAGGAVTLKPEAKR